MCCLRDSPVGEVVRNSGHDARFGEDYEVDAFIPHDLPDSVDLPGGTWMAVSDAAAELGRLDAAASLIPRPQLVVRIATRREAIGTSALDSPTRRQLAYRRVAEALERRYGAGPGPRVAELARHWVAATAPSDTTTAVRYAQWAGQAALSDRAFEDAVDWFSQALELQARQPPAAQFAFPILRRHAAELLDVGPSRG